jgi:hypothetical protein
MEARPQLFFFSHSLPSFVFLASALPENRRPTKQADHGNAWRGFDNPGKHDLCKRVICFLGVLCVFARKMKRAKAQRTQRKRLIKV